jgi:CheY-specific phosphatase CheX
MSEAIETAVFESAAHVFETSAFMSVFPWEDGNELPMPDIAATMSFNGHSSGRLTLQLVSRVLDMLAENMLGEQPEGEDADEKRQDALKEVLNMICGNFLTQWVGEDPVFELSPPSITDINSPVSNDGLSAPISVLFNLEDTCARILVSMQDT